MAGFAARSRGWCLNTLAACLGLFLTAFFAATLLPMQSEAALVGLLLTDSYAVWALVAAASLGNVAGSVVNWIIGRGVERFRNRRWFPVSEAGLQRAQRCYRRRHTRDDFECSSSCRSPHAALP